MSRWEGFEEFVQVVKSGGFSAAARVLGVSKGHVSQQVSRLEDRLGARLLYRTTRKVSPTEIGELYYQQCRQIVEDLEEAERSINSLQQETRGLLKISAPHLLGEAHIVPALADFLKQHPKLEIELNLSSRKIDLVEDGYDLAIQVGAHTETNVVNQKLAPTGFSVVGSPEYFQHFGAPLKPSDLKKHRCLVFTEYGQGKRWKFVGPKGLIRISVPSQWHSNSGHALRAAAKQGLGLAYLPGYYLKEEVSAGNLKIVLQDWSAVDRDIVAIYQHKRHLSAKIRLFVEFLKQHFEAATD